MSKAGLILCCLYLAVTGLCVWAALDASADPKGRFVLLQLPLALQLAALHWLGLGELFSGTSWVVGYLLIGVPTLALLYGMGWGLERLGAVLVSQVRSPPR